MSARRRALAAAAGLVLLGAPALAASRWDNGICLYGLSDVRHQPRFADYPARRTASRPALPVLASAGARRYRAMLRRGAARGPDFAGNFTIVRWGCGSACVAWAIADARSGRVFFPAGLGTVVGMHALDDRLAYRADSRLLAVIGAPEEDEAREGILFLEWTGTALRRLRFVPVRELCRS